jgi:hypothetical protein
MPIKVVDRKFRKNISCYNKINKVQSENAIIKNIKLNLERVRPTAAGYQSITTTLTTNDRGLRTETKQSLSATENPSPAMKFHFWRIEIKFNRYHPINFKHYDSQHRDTK